MASSLYKISNIAKFKISDYLKYEYTADYEKAYLFDNLGELREKWIGCRNETSCTGITNTIFNIKKEGKFPIFAHSHPRVTSFSTTDFFTMIFDEDITPIPQIVSTKQLNFIFIPRENKYPFDKMKMVKYVKERLDYIVWDDGAKNLLKRKIFKGNNFSNTYKYFWGAYVSATVADFVNADFYISPKTKKGFEYYNLMKKGVHALGGFDLELF